jgi:hypothetical protein
LVTATRHPAWVQRATKALNTPGSGWVIRVLPKTFPVPTGISAVLARGSPAAEVDDGGGADVLSVELQAAASGQTAAPINAVLLGKPSVDTRLG